MHVDLSYEKGVVTWICWSTSLCHNNNFMLEIQIGITMHGFTCAVMSILEMLFHIAWTNLDVPFAPSLSHCLNDVPILSCFLQWANLLDLTFWMSCGDKYIYMFGAWNHDGGSWQCMYPYLTHGTEHASTLCKCLSCANNILSIKADPRNFSGIWDVWYVINWNLINSGVSSMALCRSQILLFSGCSHN